MRLTRKQWQGIILTLGVFIVYFLVAVHKLTHASLWVDESIEFWYSRVLTGPLPFENSSGMIERINSTFQPPLYNFLMYFWLQISTSQWWFRFFGVIAGFFGMIGLYRSTYFLTKNVYASAGAVFTASFMYQLVYYWQEAAEYCLLLSFLFWALDAWIRLMKAPKKGDLIRLTVFSVLSVYSQYGAVFPVFMMLVSTLVAVIRKKDPALTRTLMVSWAVAFLFGALPLLWFFFLPQFGRHQGSNGTSIQIRFYHNNILFDFLGGPAAVFQWNVAPFLPVWAVGLLFALFVGLGLLMLLKGSRYSRLLIGCNVGLWIVYYIVLKLKLYAYGNFRGRYSLFFLPCWLILVIALLADFVQRIRARDLRLKTSSARMVLCVLCCLCLIFCGVSWELGIKNNWEKEDMRSVTQIWARENPEGKPTIVYYALAAGFAYYLENDPACIHIPKNDIHYMAWAMRGLKQEEYDAWFTSRFGENWPSEIYFTAHHFSRDVHTILDAFAARGYQAEQLNGNNDVRLTRGE